MENDKMNYVIRCSCRKQFTGVTFEPPTVASGFPSADDHIANSKTEPEPHEVLGTISGNYATFVCPHCQKTITKKRKRTG